MSNFEDMKKSVIQWKSLQQIVRFAIGFKIRITRTYIHWRHAPQCMTRKH